MAPIRSRNQDRRKPSAKVQIIPDDEPDRNRERDPHRNQHALEPATATIPYYNKRVRNPTGNSDHQTALNTIVLEYLEKCGLEETYKMFLKEGYEKRLRLPKSLHEPNFHRVQFSSEAGQKLLTNFDSLEGGDVLDLWSDFLEAEEPSRELLRTTMMLRIYVASIPFRRRQGPAEKKSALDDLQIFLSKNSEELTKDEVCVPLFAFSFVKDPQSNPAFQAVFSKEWLHNLRQTVYKILSRHYEAHSIFGSPRCEFTRMYFNYVEQYGDTQAGQSQKAYRRPSEVLNGHPGKLVPIEQLKQAQNRIKDLQDHGRCLKQRQLYDYHQYYKLLVWTNNLTQCWRQVLLGNEHGSSITSHFENFPQIGPSTTKSPTTDPDDEQNDYDAIAETEAFLEQHCGPLPPDEEPVTPPASAENEESSPMDEEDQDQESPRENDNSDTYSTCSSVSLDMDGTYSDSLDESCSSARTTTKSTGKYSKETLMLPCDSAQSPGSPEDEPEMITLFKPENVSDDSALSTACTRPGSQEVLVNPGPALRAQTYEVTPRNAGSSTTIYIPASTQVGCETPKTVTARASKARPGVPRAGQGQGQMTIAIPEEPKEPRSPRARWMQPDQTQMLKRLAAGKPIALPPPPRTNSLPFRPTATSAPTTSSGLKLSCSLTEDFNEAVKPKILPKREKGSTFMDSVMAAVIPSESVKGSQNSHGDTLANKAGQGQRPRKVAQAASSSKQATSNLKASKTNLCATKPMATSKPNLHQNGNMKLSNANTSTTVKPIRPAQYVVQVPRGSKSGDTLSQRDLLKKC